MATKLESGSFGNVLCGAFTNLAAQHRTGNTPVAVAGKSFPEPNVQQHLGELEAKYANGTAYGGVRFVCVDLVPNESEVGQRPQKQMTS